MIWTEVSIALFVATTCSKRCNVVGEFLNCRRETDDKEDRHTVDGYWPDLENVAVGYVPCIPILCI